MDREFHRHFRAIDTGDSNGPVQLRYETADKFESQAGGPVDIQVVGNPDPVIMDDDTDVVVRLCCGNPQIPVFFPPERMFECVGKDLVYHESAGEGLVDW